MDPEAAQKFKKQVKEFISELRDGFDAAAREKMKNEREKAILLRAEIDKYIQFLEVASGGGEGGKEGERGRGRGKGGGRRVGGGEEGLLEVAKRGIFQEMPTVSRAFEVCFLFIFLLFVIVVVFVLELIYLLNPGLFECFPQ